MIFCLTEVWTWRPVILAVSHIFCETFQSSRRQHMHRLLVMSPLVLKGTINNILLECVHRFVQSDIRLLLCCWCVIVLTLQLSSCLSLLRSLTHAPCFAINNSSFSVDFPLPHRKTNVLLQDKQRGERGKEMMTHQKERTRLDHWKITDNPVDILKLKHTVI